VLLSFSSCRFGILFFAPRSFVEGRFWLHIPCIHQHWRCIFPFTVLQNLGLQPFAETAAHAASTAEEQKTIGVVLQPTAQSAAYHHCSDLATSNHGLPSHTSGRKTEAMACVLEVATAGSFLFCNQKQELVHFVCIQIQQRFLKVQTDHSAQLTATPWQPLVNS
jgi:hypothetical protein